MRLPRKSVNSDIDIKDYYAIKVGLLWQGFKQESPAYWWLCVLLFLEYVRPATLYPVIDILPWSQITLLFCIIAAVTDKNIKWVRSGSNILVVLFYIVVLLSGVFAFDPHLSWAKVNTAVN